jgi:hypothetical protein
MDTLFISTDKINKNGNSHGIYMKNINRITNWKVGTKIGIYLVEKPLAINGNNIITFIFGADEDGPSMNEKRIYSYTITGGSRCIPFLNFPTWVLELYKRQDIQVLDTRLDSYMIFTPKRRIFFTLFKKDKMETDIIDKVANTLEKEGALVDSLYRV